MPVHYLNQCWFIVISSPKNKYHQFESKYQHFKKCIYLKLSLAKCLSGFPGLVCPPHISRMRMSWKCLLSMTLTLQIILDITQNCNIAYGGHKSHNASVSYSIMRHLVTEMCTSVAKWRIVRYLSNEFGIREMDQTVVHVHCDLQQSYVDFGKIYENCYQCICPKLNYALPRELFYAFSSFLTWFKILPFYLDRTSYTSWKCI